jgi:hypothetical protein
MAESYSLDDVRNMTKPAESYSLADVAAMAKAKPASRLDSFLTGAADPFHGGAQLLTNALPKGVVEAGNAFNNWLADKTGLVARLPAGGVDQQVRERETQYQADRSAAGESGFDGFRLLGNVVSPANLALSGAATVPAAASLAARVGVGAVGGAATSALNPVSEGDYWSEKGKQMGTGAAFGAATPVVMGGVSRLLSPNASTNPQLQLLRQEGVRPTIGQTLGGRWNAAEEKLTSVPLVGDMIANARRGAAEDLNRAAYNRALTPIGQQMPRGVVGRDAVNAAEDAVSAGYNRLLPNLTFQADQQFGANLANLRRMVATGAIDPRAADSFERILQNDVLAKFGGQGAMTGETFKRVESDLGQHIRRLSSSTDADQRLVGDALQTVQAEMRQALTRSNPNHANELSVLNRAWANFKRPQRAAASLGAEDGVFSPAQLQSAVKALDRSKDKAAFARGTALMQDLSEAGKTVLGNRVPDSGTPGRAMLAGLSLLDPSMTAPALMGTGALLYTRPVQGLLSGAIAARPQAAQPVAQALRQASPALVPLGAQIGLGLLNQ